MTPSQSCRVQSRANPVSILNTTYFEVISEQNQVLKHKYRIAPAIKENKREESKHWHKFRTTMPILPSNESLPLVNDRMGGWENRSTLEQFPLEMLAAMWPCPIACCLLPLSHLQAFDACVSAKFHKGVRLSARCCFLPVSQSPISQEISSTLPQSTDSWRPIFRFRFAQEIRIETKSRKSGKLRNVTNNRTEIEG